MGIKNIVLLFVVLLGVQCVAGKTDMKQKESPKIEHSDKWIRPSAVAGAAPVWGFKDGIRVSICPGPRGLISIHAPYLKYQEQNVLQFIAMEPIVKDGLRRGFSELEYSSMDGKQGKHIWSSDTDVLPLDLDMPAAGVIEMEKGVETLTINLFCEKFENGAEVYVKIKFTEGKPYQFEITPCVTGNSADLDRYVLTATMCNKPRLRNLYLDNGITLASTDIWPEYKGINFTDHFHVSPANMVKDNKGGVWLIAASDEEDTTKATYDEGTAGHWKYDGIRGTQYWHTANPSDALRGVVNGRYTYWASENPIPGGIAFENFEMTEPYEPGQSYIFGISPQSPEELIADIRK